jgi:hypothetical protein
MNDTSKFTQSLKWIRDGDLDILIGFGMVVIFIAIAISIVIAVTNLTEHGASIDDHRAFVEDCLSQEYYTRAECITIANAKVFGND